MSLQFIIGGSGSGKSYKMREAIIQESLKRPDTKFLIIVPEQFSLQAQMDFVRMHPDKGILNIDVLSFERLAYRVLEETGGNTLPVLRDTGKSLLLRRAAEDIKDELSVFGRNIHRLGYINEMKSLLSELAQYRIGKNELIEMISLSAGRAGLAAKLHDISLLQKRFGEYLENTYITGEELLTRLCRFIPSSGNLKGAVIAFDGFTGFTPIQLEVITELMKTAERIMAAFECGADETVFGGKTGHSLFSLSRENCEELCRLASCNHVEIADPLVMPEPYPRFIKAEALAHLEKYLFRGKKHEYKGDPGSISIHRTRNPEEEIRFVATRIQKLIREDGYRYKEIAVIVSNMEVYGSYARLIFEECGIPHFLDYKRSVLQNAFVEFMRSAIALVEERFSYESVFRFLKSGIYSMDEDDVFLLENYVLSLGIHGYRQWEEKWIRTSSSVTEAELERVEELREKLMAELGGFTAAMRNRSRTVESMTRALYELFTAQNAQQKCKEKEMVFLEEGKTDIAKEYGQIYKAVLSLFDQLVELLGDKSVSVTQYRELMDEGLDEARIGITPPSMDRVTVGDMERTRLTDIRALFCVGFDDKYLPGESSRTGILNERERDYLKNRNIRLAPGVRDRIYIQRFYLYLNLTKPSERLYLSFCNVDMDGKSMRPSFYLQEMHRVFPDIKEIDEIPEEYAAAVGMSVQADMRFLAAGLTKGTVLSDPLWLEIYAWYSRQYEKKHLTEALLDAHFLKNPNERLTRETAIDMYGQVMYSSATRLETFARCPYAFFLRYGLGLKEREEYLFRPVDEGSIVHRALFLFGRSMNAKGYDWRTTDQSVCREICKEALSEAVADYGNSVLYSTARRSYAIRRIEATLDRTIWALCEQLKPGDFNPAGFEISFGGNDPDQQLALSYGCAMRLRGQVDRLDFAEKDGKVYVKVIDYKTGSKRFEYTNVYHGLDMQLFLYLMIAEQYAKRQYPADEAVPAGVMYYQVRNPILNKEDVKESVDAAMLKELKMSGVVNDLREAIEQFDRGFFTSTSGTKDYVIPAGLKKDGTFTQVSSVMTTEEFVLVRDFLEKKLKEFGNSILSGDIDVSPYSFKTEDGCQYCLFKGVCRFNARLPGYCARVLPKYEKEEVIEKIREEVRHNDELDR